MLDVGIGQHHLDAGGAQARQAGAIDLREGVGQGDDDPGQAGGDERVAARRRAPVVGAGLQRDPGRGARCRLALRLRIAQRHHLGVGAAGLLRGAPAQHAAVCMADDTAHAGVGFGQAEGGFCERQCVLQTQPVQRRQGSDAA